MPHDDLLGKVNFRSPGGQIWKRRFGFCAHSLWIWHLKTIHKREIPNADSNHYWNVWILRVKCEISKCKTTFLSLVQYHLPFQAYRVRSPQRYRLSGLGLGSERTEALIMKYGLLEEQDKSGGLGAIRATRSNAFRYTWLWPSRTITYTLLSCRPLHLWVDLQGLLKSNEYEMRPMSVRLLTVKLKHECRI